MNQALNEITMHERRAIFYARNGHSKSKIDREVISMLNATRDMLHPQRCKPEAYRTSTIINEWHLSNPPKESNLTDFFEWFKRNYLNT